MFVVIRLVDPDKCFDPLSPTFTGLIKSKDNLEDQFYSYIRNSSVLRNLIIMGETLSEMSSKYYLEMVSGLISFFLLCNLFFISFAYVFTALRLI